MLSRSKIIISGTLIFILSITIYLIARNRLDSVDAKEELVINSSSDIEGEEILDESLDSSEIVEYIPDESEVSAIARTLYAECRGIPSKQEKAAVVWTILNRVDAGHGDSVISVLTQPYQFAYSPYYPVLDDLAELARDVLIRWNKEKLGDTDVGRVLPSDYLYFSGDGIRNHFRNAYRGGTRWDWSLPNPYEN